MNKIIILIGSKVDLPLTKDLLAIIKKFEIEYTIRVASAHKTPTKVLEIIKEYKHEAVVFITVVGRSNALSGMVDANTTRPVIACPSYSDKFAGNDILSSLRMPSGVCPLVVLEPEAAALAALKILALKDKKLEKKIEEYQENKKKEIEKIDKFLLNKKP